MAPAVTVSGQTPTTQFAYSGLALLSLSASQSGGTANESWKITYLYGENGRPYAGIYREPATSTTPVVFGMVTTDRGDVVELLDAAGNPFAAYRYDAWGNPLGSGNVSTGVWMQSTALIAEALATDIATRQPLRYAGYFYDQESGLYYLSAREYDPRSGQFLTKDPLKTSEESAYQYCGGNPVGLVDPSGTYASGTDDHQKSGLGWRRAALEARQEARRFERMVGLADAAAGGDETAAALLLRWTGTPEWCITPEAVQDVIEMFAPDPYVANEPTPGEDGGVVSAATSTSVVRVGVTAQALRRSNVADLMWSIMRTNAAYAARKTEGMGMILTGLWIYSQIKDRGPWDWKSVPGIDATYFEANIGMTPEDFGNLSIGYYARACGLDIYSTQFASWFHAKFIKHANAAGMANEVNEDEYWMRKGYGLIDLGLLPIDNGVYYYVVYQ